MIHRLLGPASGEPFCTFANSRRLPKTPCLPCKEFFSFPLVKSGVFGIVSRGRAESRFPSFSVFQFSSFPVFQFSSFPVFQFPVFQFSSFPVFQKMIADL